MVLLDPLEECQERVSRGTIRDDGGALEASNGKWGLHSIVGGSHHPVRKGSSSRRSSACSGVGQDDCAAETRRVSAG